MRAWQVTQRVPEVGNTLLAGIPRTLDVKGLELNISLAGDPLVTADALVVRDWGRFQSPFAALPLRAALQQAWPPQVGDGTGGWQAREEAHQGQARSMGGSRMGDGAEVWPVAGGGRGGDMEKGAASGLLGQGSVGSGQGLAGGGQGSLGRWEECPYRRALSEAALMETLGLRFPSNKEPMIVGTIDQSIANWWVTRLHAMQAWLHASGQY